MNNLNLALQYWEKGWSIIPIKIGSKLPAISSWDKYKNHIPTKDEIINWWTINPTANIALICGKVSNIIVVDIDSGKGIPDLSNLSLPPTLSAKTGGGGTHLFYKWRKGLIGAKVGIRHLVDIRSDNSYVVIPPSLHASGNNYEWCIDENEEITEAPEWLNDNKQQIQDIKPKTNWDEFCKTKNTEGSRNDLAAKLSGKILSEMSRDTWETLGLMTLKGWNSNFNIPALQEKELMTIWESIKKTHIKSNPKRIDDEIKIEEDTTSNDEEKQILKTFLKNKTEGTYNLAQYIVNKYNIITVGEKEREMYVYRDGYYHPHGENTIIFPEIQRILAHHVNKNAKTETFHKIADMTSYSRSIFSQTDIRFIPLKNGVYDLETDTLLPHDPKYRFTYQLPIIHNTKSICPKTEAFMEQVLSPKQKTIIEEWIGYYFYRNYMFKKAIIFVGDGDTGKTTLLEVITNLLGRDNLSSISLQKMTGDKFSAAHLYEKHGNIVDELSAKDISDTGAFKMATGGGSITGEYKFGNQFSFCNFSKFTFACNRIPDVNDTNDEAYFNRWMVIRFENTIKNKIPNFINTLIDEEERSGLFNLAIKGLKRLLEQQRFTYNNTANETKTEMMRSGSSIAMFASDMLEKADDYEMTKEDMYESYVKYCSEKNLSTQTIKMLGTKLPDYIPYIADGLINVLKGKSKVDRVRGWRNVKIRGSETKGEQNFGDFDNIKPDDITI